MSDEDQAKNAGPLRQLPAEQLGRYSFKAMTTWGLTADLCIHHDKSDAALCSWLQKPEHRTLLEDTYLSLSEEDHSADSDAGIVAWALHEMGWGIY